MPRPGALLFLSLWLAGGCLRLTSRDAFPVGAVQLHSVANVTSVPVTAAGRDVSVYLLRVNRARGLLLFFGGSGNDTQAQLRALAPHATALGLDLMVLSYYRQGEAIPSVGEVRTICRAVYAAARAIVGSDGRILLVGHSLGAWLALDVAADLPVDGLIVAGAETTATETIRATVPLARIIAIRPDADAAQLDASRYAPRVTAPTLVVTSTRDRDVPSAITQAVYRLLAPSVRKQLLILTRPSHGAYFSDPALWATASEFFALAPAP